MRIFTLFLFSFFISINAQNNIVDSLINHYSKDFNSKNDTVALRAYSRLGTKISYYDIERSYPYLQKGLEIAIKLNYTKAIAAVSNVIAANYSDEAKHFQALEIYEKALASFLELNNKNKASQVLINIAQTYVDLGDYKTALEKDIEALKLKIESGDSTNIAKYYISFGITYDLLNNPIKHKENILIANKLADNPDYASLHVFLECRNELGRVYELEKNNTLALKIYEEMYNLSKKENHIRGMSVSLTNTAQVLMKLGNYQKALKMATEALKYDKQLGRQYGIFSSLNRIADLQIKLGDFRAAKKNLDTALKKYFKYGFPSEQQRTYLNYYKLFKNINRPSDALKYHEKYEELKDSLRSVEVNEKILEMDTKFKTVQKDKKIALLNKDKELQEARIARQHLTIIGIIVSVSLITILAFFISKRRKEKLLLEKTNSELKMLRAQLNPHFIFNSLNAIQNFILTNNKFEGSDYLSDFSRLIRLILDSSREDQITISEEIELIEKYLSLQKLRFQDSFEYEIKNNLTKNYFIPSMLLQPFIENSIEHGLSGYSNKEGLLKITISENNNQLIIEMTDNGAGLGDAETKSAKQHKSHALNIISERVNNLNKKNGNYINYKLIDLKNENSQGTKVVFIVNMEDKND